MKKKPSPVQVTFEYTVVYTIHGRATATVIAANEEEARQKARAFQIEDDTDELAGWSLEDVVSIRKD